MAYGGTDPRYWGEADEQLLGQAFSSPHLYQLFCREYVKASGVRRTSEELLALSDPDWETFFRGQGSVAERTAFEMLARGPRARTDRKARTLKDGRVVDIYGVVLEAIAHTGPLTQLTYEELRAAVRDVIAPSEDPPQRHEITRVLDEMNKIASDQIEGEPVMDWDPELSILHIVDPFFAFYLRWGGREGT